MFARMRRVGQLGRVELCEGSGQVCTPASRAQALRERTRTEALYRSGFLR